MVIYLFWKSKAAYVPHKVNKVIHVNGSDDDNDDDDDDDDNDDDDDDDDDDNDDGTTCFQAADTVKTITGTLTIYLLKLMASKCNM